MIRTVSLNGVAAASAAGNGRGDMAAAPDAACSFTDVDVATRVSLVDAHTAFIQVKKVKYLYIHYGLTVILFSTTFKCSSTFHETTVCSCIETEIDEYCTGCIILPCFV
jgi:hypothetical protein